ncbi:MAG: outer membrane protein [Rhodomicrobium sp.]
MTRLHYKLASLSLLSTIALAPALNAADLYRTPPPASYAPPAAYVDTYSWAGFYAGVNGGYGWSNGGNALGYNDGGAGFIGGTDQSARAQPQGGFGGGQIGYNFQRGSIVYGFETDFQGGDMSDRVSGVTANGNGFTSRESADWFGTVRGRLGYAFGRTLFYGTGGFAYGDVRQNAFVTDSTAPESVSLRNSGVQTGYTVGGGIEYKITPSWSLKGEYQYIDFGSEKLNGIDTTGAAVTANGADTSFSTVKLGLNYRFGGAAEPLK